LLAFSVLTAFILLYQVWFSGYFLPDGYDYVTSGLKTYIINPVTGLFKRDADADFSQNLNALLKPEKIVVNLSGERRVFTNGTTGFDESLEFSADILSSFLLEEYKLISKETVNLDAYTSVLKGKSIYVDYGKTCDSRLLSFAVSGQDTNPYTTELHSFQGYIISMHDSILNHISIYIKDEKSGNIYKYVVESDQSDLETQLGRLLALKPSEVTLSYSFELNFHKQQEGQETKLMFDPMILMELMPAQVETVRGYTLADFDQNLNFYQEDSVLNLFAINTRSIGKYTDLNNAKVFVANNATLTLHPGGYLEYQVVQGGRGIDIAGKTDKSDYDIYKATANAVDFVTDLSAGFPPEFFEHLQLSSDLIDDTTQQGVYTVCFDYCLDGIPVLHQTEAGPAHSVEMEIDNGYLKSYRQFTRAYEKVEGEKNLQPIIAAADTLVDTLYTGQSPLQVKKITQSYLDMMKEGVEPCWSVHVDDEERLIR